MTQSSLRVQIEKLIRHRPAQLTLGGMVESESGPWVRLADVLAILGAETPPADPAGAIPPRTTDDDGSA